MLSTAASYSAATRLVTLTDLTDAEAPSGGAVRYDVLRRRPGHPDAVVASVPLSSSVVTVGPVQDGMYRLLLRAFDDGTEEAPISPPELIDLSDVLVVTANGGTAERLSDATERRATDYLRGGLDGDAPLDAQLLTYARLTEADALVAESAPDAADRLLRHVPAPTP